MYDGRVPDTHVRQPGIGPSSNLFLLDMIDGIFNRMRKSFTVLMTALCGMLTLSACGGRRAMETGPALTPECFVLPAPAEWADTIRIALPGKVDPLHAPAARSESERILFGHLYETLVTIDCRGKVRPGLAASWYSGEGGRRWTFDLRPDARYWDKSPVTPRDVVLCWQRPNAEALIWAAGVDSAAVVGERSVHVYLSRPHKDIPGAVSTRLFAVAKHAPPHRWPIGSGPYRIESEPMWASLMHRRSFTASPAFNADGPVIRFIEPEARDARDLLEGTVDIMITADPDVIEYAAARPHLEIAPLPWNMTYVLLSTSRVRDIRSGRIPAGISREFSDGLAQDAVRGVARGHQASCWWDGLNRCAVLFEGAEWRPSLTHSAYAPSAPRRILYDRSDPVARDLAERIVALAVAGPGASPEATQISSAIPELAGQAQGIAAAGATGAEIRESLLEGDDFAYIIALPLNPPDPCNEAKLLVENARWLTGLGGDFARALLPLVDTRRHVIMRRGAAGLSIDWYGNPFVTGALPQEAAVPPGR